MQVSITPQMKAQIDALMESGRYSDVNELFLDALQYMVMDEVQFASITNRSHTIDSENVFNRMQEDLYRGHLEPGDPLPSPEEIAQEMRVSAHAVETAFERLVDANYVEPTDDGFRVTSNPPHATENPFSCVAIPHCASIHDLLEVRAGLEAQGVALAVERATEQDIRFIEEALETAHANATSGKAHRDADIAFHMAIAYATHNIVYIDLIKRFYEQMYDEIDALHELLSVPPHHVRIVEQHHFKILNSITSRDKDGAKRHMLQHIMFLKGFINKQSQVG